MSNAESAWSGGARESAYGGAHESAYGGALHASPRKRSLRWMRPLLAVLMAVCGLLLLVRFAGEPLTRIRHVTVHSDVPLTDDEVLALSGLQGREHWYSVSEAAIEKRLEASPLVRRAEVQRVFPDAVRMTVWGRQPAALVLAARDGHTVPVLVDEDGVVYRVGVSGADMDLPVVSGLSAGEVSLGSALPRAACPVFADLRALRDHAPALYALVSEVRITGSADAPGTELLVYLTSARVPIRTRGTIDESLVKYALMVIDLLSRQGVLKDIQELDFRSGDVVYRRAVAARLPAAVPAAAPAATPGSTPAPAPADATMPAAAAADANVTAVP